MFDYLTQDAFLTLAKTHTRIMVHKEIAGDQITPVQAYQALQADMAGATLLESSPKEKAAGRYSFMGFNVLAQFRAKNTTLCTQIGDDTATQQGEGISALRAFYKQMRAHSAHSLAGFAGGIVGFLAYDCVRQFESLPHAQAAANDFPDILFKCYQDHIAFDPKTQQVVLATLVDCTQGEPAALYETAKARLDAYHQRLLSAQLPMDAQSQASQADATACTVTAQTDDAQFMQGCRRIQDYIAQGDAFQVVQARTFTQSFKGNPFDIYRLLRLRSPSPYMFYLDNEDFIATGASPEKLISVQDNVIQSSPLAGTRPRGEGIDDAAQAAALLADPKETAEHMMLVDLARNDTGAVAVAGGVEVKSLQQVQKFSHVMHIASLVEAPLAPQYDCFDALKAAFPAGTLSGAPKIRAMEIVDEVEGTPRALYGGAICSIDSQGNLDSCIAIRMTVLKDNTAYVSAGAGVVADSDPQAEADETRHKARAILEAIEYAQRGLA